MEKIKQDDVLTLTVDSMGMEGEGITHADDYVFFVPFALPGEQIRAKVNYVKKNLVFCHPPTVLVPSPSRVQPPCNRFPKCGGCDLLHMAYEKQLTVKRNNVKTLLRKNADIDVDVDETVPCSTPFGYRNKIQLPFGTVNGKTAVGFFRENSHKIVSITKCFLHGDWVEKLISVFLAYAEKFNITAYSEDTHKGVLRHLVARYIDGQYCIVVVTNACPLPHTDALLQMLTDAVGTDFSLFYSPKKEYNNVILGKTVLPIRRRDFLISVLGVQVSINPFSFLQLNDEIRDLIYTKVSDGIPNNSFVIDAYAGVGILGATLAKRGCSVFNIEIVPEATEDGKVLAKNNGLSDRVTNLNGDAALLLPPLLKQLPENAPVSIILDPPRKGIDSTVTDALCGIDRPVSLFYISCNPATLTRDLKGLSARYDVLSVTPYDMFPQTKHVETLVTLRSKNIVSV